MNSFSRFSRTFFLYNILFLSLFGFVTYTHCSILTEIRGWFTGYKEEVSSQEYVLLPNSKLSIENIEGDITIKTWKQDKLVLDIIKQGDAQTLQETKIQTNYTADGIIIKTVPDSSQLHCVVNYTLLVPHTATLAHVHTDKGEISIKNSIQSVNASTYTGNISVKNSKNSVSADTKYGNITIEAKNLQKEHKILAVAHTGNITLELPGKTKAKLYAKTSKGKITTDHDVTLAPRTMRISQNALSELRRDVQGSLGATSVDSVNSSTIKLFTEKGNVKLVQI